MCMRLRTRKGSESSELECNENDSQSSETSCTSSVYTSVSTLSTATAPTFIAASTSKTELSKEGKSLLATLAWAAIRTTIIVLALTLVTCRYDLKETILHAINYGGIGQIFIPISSTLNRISHTGFYQAFSLVLVSEIGDKTFFIAGLLAMKSGKIVSFTGSIIALAAMTALSVIIGQLFHAVPVSISNGIPCKDLAAVIAFAFFGVKTLKEALELKDGDSSGIEEEYSDAEEAVKGCRTIREITAWGKIVSTIGLVFAAEFGDRSFISTIALSAAQNPFSVGFGAISGHTIATSIAVTGGSYIAKHISEKTILSTGGCLFLVFALSTASRLF